MLWTARPGMYSAVLAKSALAIPPDLGRHCNMCGAALNQGKIARRQLQGKFVEKLSAWPTPTYHTKACSCSSVDSPGARTLVFAAFQPFRASIARTPFCAILWRSPISTFQMFVANMWLQVLPLRNSKVFDRSRTSQTHWAL